MILFSQEALKLLDFTPCVFSPTCLLVMAPKKMIDAGDEQQQQSTQMTDDQLLQLAVATVAVLQACQLQVFKGLEALPEDLPLGKREGF